jgi:Tol biopolymer transport system component
LCHLDFRPAKDTAPSSPSLIPLTIYPGYERNPSFSPDGTQVAFCWDGGVPEGNEDIYVKVVGPDAPLRLTHTPARELSPAWSPDGRLIAFLRFLGPGRAEIVAVPALGGNERKLGETSSIVTPRYFPGHQLAWSPDGKWLCFADRAGAEGSDGLFLLSLVSGEKRRLTAVSPSDIRDRGPAFSPDGHWLAFCRVKSLGVNDIYLLGLSSAYMVEREPRPLTSDSLHTTAVSWTPGSQEVVFSSGAFESDRSISRMTIGSGNRKTREARLVRSGEDAYDVAVAPGGRRMAYTRRLQDVNIWRVELSGAHAASSRSFIASTRIDQLPKISRDGKRVAFSSGRSGTREIWIADAGENNPMQLTALGNRLTTNPAWSPDAGRLVFDSRVGGYSRLFVVNARGGTPRQLSGDPGDQLSPYWSRDGKWIYYYAGPVSNRDIWKIPVERGPAVRITRQGGLMPKESPDGQTVYYIKNDRVWKVPAGGGAEERVCSEPVDEYNFTVAVKGIYFIPPAGTPFRYSIRFFRFATRKIEVVMRLAKPPALGLAVSRDETWLLYSQFDQEGSDLMLVDNFR